jgi:hypothetical protein
MWVWIELPAFAIDQVAVRSNAWLAFASKFAPTAGALTGNSSEPLPPAEFAGLPTTLSLVHIPTCMKFALPPTARSVRSQSIHQLTFVFATTFKFSAPLLAMMFAPKLQFERDRPWRGDNV